MICIICNDKIEYTQTFVKAHIENLPKPLKVLYASPGGFRTTERKTISTKILANLKWNIGRKLFRLSPLPHFGALKKTLAPENISVIFAEFGHHGVSAMKYCHKNKIPLIVHFHGYDVYSAKILSYEGRYYKQLFEIAAALIVVSRNMQQRLLELGAPQDKIFYNPCGANTELFSMTDASTNPPVFIFVGRFITKKAPHTVLWAFHHVVSKIPQARLQMIGDGPLMASSRKLAQDLGIAQAVQFLGPRPHREVSKFLQQARGFIQHSIVSPCGDMEGTPVAILEAGMSGLPVVATRHGGIPDVVIHQQTGFLVAENDIEATAKYICRLAKEPQIAGRMGAAAGKHIREQFSQRQSIKRLQDIISQVVHSTK